MKIFSQLLKNHFLSNIENAKYNMFRVPVHMKIGLILKKNILMRKDDDVSGVFVRFCKRKFGKR